MLYCFLDTNIFLEFRPIKDIQVVAMNLMHHGDMFGGHFSVMRELDKHKSG